MDNRLHMICNKQIDEFSVNISIRNTNWMKWTLSMYETIQIEATSNFKPATVQLIATGYMSTSHTACARLV